MRKVPTASGATAVQIADKTGGKYLIVEHLGPATHPKTSPLSLRQAKQNCAIPGRPPSISTLRTSRVCHGPS